MLTVGWIPAVIAAKKGRNFTLWWFYGGGVFIVALVHALLLKPVPPTMPVTAPPARTKCDGCGKTVSSHSELQQDQDAQFLCADCRMKATW